MSRVVPPRSPIEYERLEISDSRRTALFAEQFGRWLFWIRGQSLSASRALVEDQSNRHRLGTIRRAVYEQTANMSAEQREVALNLSQSTLDDFVERLLWMFGDEGTDIRFDDRYAYRFRIQIEIVDVESRQIVEDCPVNRGDMFFGKYWGRWLNEYSH